MSNNRVTAAIGRTETRIKERLAAGLVTQEKVDALHKTLDMELLEYVKFQEHKSLAFASGKLTLEEANTIYAYLGESVETFNSQPIAVKSVLTQIFGELLGAAIKHRRAG